MTMKTILEKLVGQKAPEEEIFCGEDGLPAPAACVSAGYAARLAGWRQILLGEAPWSGGASLHLGIALCRELARLTVSEAEISVCGGERADFLREIFAQLLPRLDGIVESACGMGGVMLKPYVSGGGIGIECVPGGYFYPTEIGGDEEIVSAVFLAAKQTKNGRFLRAEWHRREPDGYSVRNLCFRVTDNGLCKAPLGAVRAWAALSPVTKIQGLSKPLFSYFRMPESYLGQRTDPMGSAVFDCAVGLLKDADRQYGRLLWEFEGGELAIDASEDAFRYASDGDPELQPGRERLFRMNCLDGGGEGELMKTFSPALRDTSLIHGLNRILMLFEDAVGVARGTFSDPCETARTATEIRSMRHRTYMTVVSIQKQLEKAILSLAEACGALATLMHLSPGGKVSVSVRYGDAVLTDSGSERKDDLEEVRAGVLTPEEFRGKWIVTDGASRKASVQNTKGGDLI